MLQQIVEELIKEATSDKTAAKNTPVAKHLGKMLLVLRAKASGAVSSSKISDILDKARQKARSR